MLYISYRFTGVDKNELSKLLTPIYTELKELNFNVFCNFYKDQFYIENKYTIKQIMDDCIDNLENSNTVSKK